MAISVYTVAEYQALAKPTPQGTQIIIRDEAYNITGLLNADPNLKENGVIQFDTTGNEKTTIIYEQLDKVVSAGISFSEDDNICAWANKEKFGDLTATKITSLALANVKFLNFAGMCDWDIRADQAKAFTDHSIKILPDTAQDNIDHITLKDSGAAIASLSPEQIAKFADKGIGAIDVTDNKIVLSVAQYAALGGLQLGSDDSITIADTGANLSALTADQLTSLSAKGIAIDVADNKIALSVAQYAAVGGLQLGSDDSITIADTGANLSALTADQLTSLSAKGIVNLDATNDVMTLSWGQYNALASIGLTLNDDVTISDNGSLKNLNTDQIKLLSAKGVDKIDLMHQALTLSASQYNALDPIKLTNADKLVIAGADNTSLTLPNESKDLTLTDNAVQGFGNAYDNIITGNAANNTLSGLDGNDVIYGLAGKDILLGGAGNDKLVGGLGADKLTGGLGADSFVFTSVKDSTLKASGRDTILDFNHREHDKLNLTAIDANTSPKKKGDQAFSFIGKKEFHHKAGELRYEKIKADTYIYGDVNGDGKADFSILLSKYKTALIKTDFNL